MMKGMEKIKNKMEKGSSEEMGAEKKGPV